MSGGQAKHRRNVDDPGSETRLGGAVTLQRSGRFIQRLAAALSVLATLGGFLLLYLVFLSDTSGRPAEASGLIHFIYLPSTVTAYLAFAVMAVTSVGYLWRQDDRLDAIGISAAELGVLFTSAALVQGSVLARLSSGEWWIWDARTTSTLLLWLIYVSYFVIRNSTEGIERGKRFAAILAVIGAVDLPFVDLSVQWFRSQYPEAVALEPVHPWTDPETWGVAAAGFVTFVFAFLALLLYRFGLEWMRRQVDSARVGVPA
jgi:heme exporter protein C